MTLLTAAASAYMAARAIHDPARDAYDALVAPDGITPALARSGGYCKGPLWDETVEPHWRAVNDADRECRRVIAAIRATAAEGLAGVAIKVLAQLPNGYGDMEDIIDGLDAVQEDIVRLTGLNDAGPVVIRVPSIPQTRAAPWLVAPALLRAGLWLVRRGLDRMGG